MAAAHEETAMPIACHKHKTSGLSAKPLVYSATINNENAPVDERIRKIPESMSQVPYQSL
eukprot:1968781-Amphidinium_carterae.1